jgi:GT2 family glycosyltransferase
MVENDQEGTLVLNDDVLLSQTFITNLKKAHHLSSHLALVPKTPSRKWKSNRLDPNFRWFNKSITDKDILETNWLCGFAFYLKNECVQLNGVFDTDYKVWFGDTDYELRLKKNIGLINNEYIYHYGGLSYDYSKQEVLAEIGKDRELFIKKYPRIGKILRSKAGKPD